MTDKEFIKAGKHAKKLLAAHAMLDAESERFHTSMNVGSLANDEVAEARRSVSHIMMHSLAANLLATCVIRIEYGVKAAWHQSRLNWYFAREVDSTHQERLNVDQAQMVRSVYELIKD